MKPVARTDRLVKALVEQDTLVYDQADDTACCLNSLASAVWRNCDGERSVEEIADVVTTEVDLPEGVEPETAVWGALNELEEHKLVAFGEGDLDETGMHRREALKVAVAGLALFPTIKSIVAPTTAMAQSPAPSSTPEPSSSAMLVTPTPSPSPSPTPSPTPTPTPS